MVFTAAQITSFFEDDDQMALPQRTRVQLQAEGLTVVADLLDFDDDSLKQMADNLRRPGGTVQDPNPNAAAGAMIPTPAFVLGAKSQMRLKAAVNIAKYYQMVGRDLTAANMKWDQVIKNFTVHWKALSDRTKEDIPDVPKISKNLVIMKWTEAFRDFLQRVVGARTIPLSYVIREPVTVLMPAPALVNNQPFGDSYESVEEEMTARASHTHALFRDDNAAVYYHIEEATRSTSYAASIKPFQRTKNGRGAWMALTTQYAGDDKWEAELKQQDDLLHTRKWKGQSNFSLERFIAQHRNAYVSMHQCAEHINYQLPNETTRVGYLLDAIETSDAALQAAMALVRNDNSITGKRNNFEATASFLLPHDPVAKKRSQKRPEAEILAVDTGNAKSGIGRSGVELRYYKSNEYKSLTKDQKSELNEWRKSNSEEGKSPGKNKTNKKSDNSKGGAKKMKRMLAEAVAKEIKSRDDAKAKEGSENDATVGAYLLSLVKASATPTSTTPTSTGTVAATTAATTTTPAVTLQSILRRSKFN